MRLVVGALTALALMLTGCTGASDSGVSPSAVAGDISVIEVGVSDTLAPTLTWPEGTEFTKSQSEVLWQGEGLALQDGQPLLLDIYVKSIDTGDVLKNTYDGLPESTLLAPGRLGDSR